MISHFRLFLPILRQAITTICRFCGVIGVSKRVIGSFKTSYWSFKSSYWSFRIELLEFQKRVIEILNRVMGVSNKVIGISNRVIALSNWVVIEDIVEFNKTKGNGSKQVPAKVCVSREWVTRRRKERKIQWSHRSCIKVRKVKKMQGESEGTVRTPLSRALKRAPT